VRRYVDKTLKKLLKFSFYCRRILIKYQSRAASQYQGGSLAARRADIQHLFWIDEHFFVIRRQASQKKHTVYPQT
jgi:hypothetical protein